MKENRDLSTSLSKPVSRHDLCHKNQKIEVQIQNIVYNLKATVIVMIDGQQILKKKK